MDREQAKAIAKARGVSARTAQSASVDHRALAKARVTLAPSARATTAADSAASHRVLAAKLLARKGA